MIREEDGASQARKKRPIHRHYRLANPKSIDINEDSGYDGGKKTKGRTRYLITDTQGLLIDAVVHSAGMRDRDGAKILLQHAKSANETIKKIYADGGYAGTLIA